MVLNSNTVTITVTAPAPIPSAITLTESASNIQTGQNDTFTATVTDQNGNPISGVAVGFFDATTNTTFATGSTNTSVIGDYIKVKWTVAGTTPSFGGVYARLVMKK